MVRSDGQPCPACGSDNTVQVCPHGAILCAACGHSRPCPAGSCVDEDQERRP